MAIELLPFVNEENAGSYAGLTASSFMVGRALSSYTWGKLADTYGRTTVLYVSLGLSCIFTLLFGVARSFTGTIFFRALLGFSNGILGTAKTAVSELANGNEKLETSGMGLVMGMWGWGFLFSPA
jgi:MFS family permease